jgi:hypothetical protein
MATTVLAQHEPPDRDGKTRPGSLVLRLLRLGTPSEAAVRTGA